MQRSPVRFRSLPSLAVASTLLLGLLAPSAAGGQVRLEDIRAYDPPESATLSANGWIDPVSYFGLDPATLAPSPEFDFAEIRQSTVLAAGIEAVEVDDDIVAPFELRYLRILQVRDTFIRDTEQAEAGIANNNDQIVRAEAQIDEREVVALGLNEEVEAERAEEERLAQEILVREEAIAEFAIRAFTGEDQVEITLTDVDPANTRTRVVTDEVREDLRVQIFDRDRDAAKHLASRLVFEEELAGVEAEIETLETEIDAHEDEITALEADIVGLTEQLGENELLAQEAADDYELALHTRLTGFVAGTDVPYVALNAYVIAARTLETEDPQCQIHWSQLAGIGRIESFHGYFGNSTLDVDGHTTEDILGLPLDGRILSGAEFITDDNEAPEATGRTEEQTVPIAEPAPAAAPADDAADPAATPAASTTEAADGGSTTDSDTAPAPEPAPRGVVKTLALILDSDDGVLDGDTVYDRAVGPMQFIPTTWRLFDADGNGDGKTEPQNIYDAALASARYLCSSTTTMTTAAGEQRAYFAYNHDLDYSRNVTNAGRGYRAEIEVENPEILENSGRYYLGVSEGVAALNERTEDFNYGEATGQDGSLPAFSG